MKTIVTHVHLKARRRTRLGRRHAQASIGRDKATGLGWRTTPPTRR